MTLSTVWRTPGIGRSPRASAATRRARDPRVPRHIASPSSARTSSRWRPPSGGNASTSSGTTGVARSHGRSRVTIRSPWCRSPPSRRPTPPRCATRCAARSSACAWRTSPCFACRSSPSHSSKPAADSSPSRCSRRPDSARRTRIATSRRCARSARPDALNWYRALGTERGHSAPVSVPVLHVWGDHDPVFTREATELSAEHCTGDYHLLELEGGSHWIPDEHWADVADVFLDHLAANPIDSPA